jgi:glycyl-tRNA synthetase beta chain
METPDQGKRIINGNERVLKARLADAEFFWNQDLTKGLSSRISSLDNIVFHAKLGTVGEKVHRIEPLALQLAPFIPNASPDQIQSAAKLCKVDLVTGMVGEFPELQGLMGQYYAIHDGTPHAVAKAIGEHYSPLGPSDPCPKAPISVAIALSDKLDTLAGFWSINEKPTGSKDPFALRRAALGVIRLILENNLRLSLLPTIHKALSLLAVSDTKRQDIADNLLSFIVERMRVSLKDQGIRHDLIAAVFTDGSEDDLVRGLNRVDALSAFITSEDGSNLLAAYRRASNILKKEEKKDGRIYDQPVHKTLLIDPHEIAFAQLLEENQIEAINAITSEDFSAAMAIVAKLRSPGDAFFENVMVNVSDANVRENRLNLLNQLRQTLSQVADFNQIES